jgi:hypothetical protein
MKSHIRNVAVAVAILAGAPAANASIYDVNFSFAGFQDNPSGLSLGPITVTGKITTTCDTCVLGPGDIGSWSFTWNGNLSGTASGTFNNIEFANTLSASGGEISFIAVSGGASAFDDLPAQVWFGQF